MAKHYWYSVFLLKCSIIIIIIVIVIPEIKYVLSYFRHACGIIYDHIPVYMAICICIYVHLYVYMFMSTQYSANTFRLLYPVNLLSVPHTQ